MHMNQVLPYLGTYFRSCEQAVVASHRLLQTPSPLQLVSQYKACIHETSRLSYIDARTK
jgi:hypothetical protein